MTKQVKVRQIDRQTCVHKESYMLVFTSSIPHFHYVFKPVVSLIKD